MCFLPQKSVHLTITKWDLNIKSSDSLAIEAGIPILMGVVPTKNLGFRHQDGDFNHETVVVLSKKC